MNNLRELRRQAGLNQQQLAASAGVSRTTISRTERGVTKPRYEIWTKILKGLYAEPKFFGPDWHPTSKGTVKCRWCGVGMADLRRAVKIGDEYYHRYSRGGGEISCNEQRLKTLEIGRPQDEEARENLYGYEDLLAEKAIQAIAALKDRRDSRQAREAREAAIGYLFYPENGDITSFAGTLEYFGIDVGKSVRALEQYR